MGDVYTKALVNTMRHILTEVQDETPRDTLHDVQTVGSAYTVANRLGEVRP